MQVGQAQDLGLPGSIRVERVREIEPFEALEKPAQGGAADEFAHLIGNGLACCGQSLADAQFSQLVHRAATAP